MTKSEKSSDLHETVVHLVREGMETRERLELLEKVHAKLHTAYVEMATAFEVLSNEVMAPRDEEERRAYRDEIRRRFHETMQTMRQALDDHRTDDARSRVQRAMDHLADREQSDSDAESGPDDRIDPAG